jgi:GNAT superfamily N-acetyltransferase
MSLETAGGAHAPTPTDTPAAALTLRAGTLDDLALIAGMHAQSWVSAYRGMLSDQYLDHEVQAERLAHWQAKLPALTAGAGAVLIAQLDGVPSGFACMLAPDTQGSVLIDQLHALPARKGGGLGTAMLAAARQWALAEGARSMHLFVLERNVAAQGFYASRGWQADGQEQHHMGGVEVVALRYRMPLRDGGSPLA